jgi:hypothetical protein
MKLNFLIVMAAISIVVMSCQTKNKAKENLAPNVHKVTAEEVIQSSNYTYLRVTEDGKESWIAITRQEVETGKSYYFEPSIEMQNFTSKELKRTFPTIVFVSKFSVTPIVAAEPFTVSDQPKGKQPAVAKDGISVKPAEGGISVADLYSKKDAYAGKTIKIKGEVVKFSPEIMGKNWVHLQDGTKSNADFDITVTTTEVVKVGDVVTFQGEVATKKDFGAGYFYEVIVENGKLVP